MAKKWYKGLTATAVAMAVAGVASMVPAFAEDTVAEPETEGNSLVLAPAAEGNKTTEVSTITDAAGNVTTETTTTTTETKEEKDPDFQPTTSKTEDTYVDSTGDIIHTETKIETSETTSEVKKESSTEVSGETVEKGETYEAKTDPSADWDSLKENETVKFGGVDFTVQSKVTGEDENGNTTYSVVMTYDVPASEKDSPITQDELSEALGQTLTKTGDNTYTYTNAEGKTVTVTVSNDESSEYTKVVVNVNVVKDGETVKDSAEIGNNMDTNIKDLTDKKGEPYEISVEEVLGYIGQDGVEVTYNDEGRVSTVVKDGKTYTFEYTQKKAGTIDISDWANEKILALLGSEYKIVDGEIVDQEGHVLTFDEKQKIARRSTIIVTSKTTTTTTDNVYGNTKEEAKEEALLAAQKAAVKAALEDYDLKDVDESKITIDGKTATYSYEKDGYQFSFTFNLSDSSIVEGETTEWSEDYIKKIEKSVKEDITKGQTTVVTSSSSVTGGTYSVIGDSSSSKQVIYLKDGVITPPEGAENVTKDSKGRVISFTFNGSSYSYSYTDKLKADDIAIFKKAHEVYHQDLGDVTVTDTDRIYKIKCTVNTTQTTKYDGEDVTYTTGAQIEVNGDQIYYVNGNEKTPLTAVDEGTKSYDYKDGKLVEITNRTYTDVSGNTLYTVTTTSSVSLKDDEILDKVDPDRSLGATVKDGKVTLNQNGTLVTYDYNDSTVTVEISRQSETSEEISGAETSKEAIEEWIQNQLDSLEEGDSLYVGDEDVTNWSVDEIMTLVDSYVDYSTMSQEEIEEYLLKLQSECKDPTSSYTRYDHTDLDTGTSFTTTDGKNVDCVVIRDELHYRIDSSADIISKNEGKDYADYLSDTVTSDGMTGYSEYRHEQSVGLTGNNFYNVTGKVAYNKNSEYSGWNAEEQANAKVAALKADGKSGAVVVKVSTSSGSGHGGHGGYSSTTYVVYEDSADLVAYGYMNKGSNVCGGRGYDLVLSDLTMTSNGTVVAKGKNTSSYSITFTKVHKNDSTETVTGDTLTLTNGKYDKQVVKEYDEFGGSYGLKLTGKFADKTYEGNGESSYSLYDTQKTETERGKATGVHYTGKLNYSYKVDKVDTAYRVDDVHEYDADVKEEWNKTVYNYTTKETVTEAVIGHVDSDSTPSTPSTKPSVDPTPSDPTPEPTVDPTPSDVTPSDSTPEPSIPDDVIDDIIAEVEEEVTPIASVPKTGAAQNTAAAAASAAALGGIAFALSRKRRRK